MFTLDLARAHIHDLRRDAERSLSISTSLRGSMDDSSRAFRLRRLITRAR